MSDPVMPHAPNARDLSPRALAERCIIKDFRARLWRPFLQAINDYRLLQDGDRIAVCVSGGKDSMLMAKLFQELHRHSFQRFDLEFLVMDPGYGEQDLQTVLNTAELLGIPVRVFATRIFTIVGRMEGRPCYPCARMRRGSLYDEARKLGCNKIALGHHFDDAVETVLMGMLYAGQVKAMMPKIRSANYEGMELIRPLYLIREADIVRWRDANGLSFIHCACPLAGADGLCGAGEGSKRDMVKALVRSLEAGDPLIAKSIFRSVENVHLDAVVGYRVAGVQHSFLERYDEGWG